jgi:hypothetical protein
LSDPQSTIENVESNMSEPHPGQQLTQMITSYWVSRAVYIAAKFRIADHLKDCPRSAEELAATAGVAPRPLYRVLRALAGLGVFAHEAGQGAEDPVQRPGRHAGRSGQLLRRPRAVLEVVGNLELRGDVDCP